MHVPAEFDEQINLYVRSSAIRQNTRSSIHRAFFFCCFNRHIRFSVECASILYNGIGISYMYTKKT